MSIQNLSNESQGVQPSSSSVPTPGWQTASKEVPVTGNTVSDTVELRKNMRTTATDMSAIQRSQDARNGIAETIRKTDSGLKELGTKLETMKSNLEGIVKNYPPFPPGSQERIQYLKAYSSLRKEVDEVTFPPPDKQSLEQVGVKSSESFFPTTGSSAGGMAEAGLPVGVVIPTTPPDHASVGEIKTAIQTIGSSWDAVMQLREKLANGAATLTNSQEFSAVRPGAAFATDMTEAAARAKSAEIKQVLPTQDSGMTVSYSPLLQGLN